MRVLLLLSLLVAATTAADPCTKSCTKCVPNPDGWTSQGECDKCAKDGPYKETDWTCSTCQCHDSPGPNCDGAVSANFGKTSNEACESACRLSDTSKFEKLVRDGECSAFGYRIEPGTNKVRFDDEGTCWDQWVHGYSDEGATDVGTGNAKIGAFTKRPVKNVVECQAACQADPTCVRFYFRAIAITDYPVGTCLLKTQEMVDRAASMTIGKDDYTSPATDPRYEWCNLGLGWRCDGGGYTCIECPEMKCVFKSENHVAGPKYCGHPQDVCEVGASTTTPPTTTTTKAPKTTPHTTKATKPTTKVSETTKPLKTTEPANSTGSSTTAAVDTIYTITEPQESTTDSEPTEPIQRPRPTTTEGALDKPCHDKHCSHLRCGCCGRAHCGCCGHNKVSVTVQFEED